MIGNQYDLHRAPCGSILPHVPASHFSVRTSGDAAGSPFWLNALSGALRKETQMKTLILAALVALTVALGGCATSGGELVGTQADSPYPFSPTFE